MIDDRPSDLEHVCLRVDLDWDESRLRGIPDFIATQDEQVEGTTFVGEFWLLRPAVWQFFVNRSFSLSVDYLTFAGSPCVDPRTNPTGRPKVRFRITEEDMEPIRAEEFARTALDDECFGPIPCLSRAVASPQCALCMLSLNFTEGLSPKLLDLLMEGLENNNSLEELELDWQERHSQHIHARMS